MLDTNICSFIMRKRPESVLKILQGKVEHRDRIVISSITYAEIRFGAIGKKASRRHNIIVDDAFMERVDEVLPWGFNAVEETVEIKRELSGGGKGLMIGANDSMIAGHAIAEKCILVTNNVKEFKRVKLLKLEDWGDK